MAKPKCIGSSNSLNTSHWIQHMAEPKRVRFNILSDLCFLGLSTWLNLNLSCLVIFQIHVALGLAHG